MQPDPLRVVYVIDSVAVPGGAEQSLALLAPEYQRLGIHLDVAVLHDRPGHQDALRAAGSEIFVVGGSTRARSVAALRSLIAQRRPDLVHTTLFEADIVGRIAAWSRRVPVVSSLVSAMYGPAHVNDPNLKPWRVRSAQCVDALTARAAVRMHAVSHPVADAMAARLHYPRSRIDVIPRGRDARALGRRTPERRAAARSTLGIDDDVALVLTVARDEHAKGLDVLLRAWASFVTTRPRSLLAIASGPGNQTETLRGLAASLGIGDSVQFLGSRADVPELLCAADCFVLPSRREGLPGAVLEAMALEVPIVVSDLPEVRELVDERTASLVPPDDPAALASGLLEALGDPAAGLDRVRLARERFTSEFTIEPVAYAMLEFSLRSAGRPVPVH